MRLVWSYIWRCPFCGNSQNIEGKVCTNPKCMRLESSLSQRTPMEVMVR